MLDRWGLRMLVGGRPLDWVVTRNRLSHLRTRNHRQMEHLLERLAPSLGYRLAPGFGERMIYRELFARGQTVLDLPEPGLWRIGNKSHAAARNEVWAFMKSIGVIEDMSARRARPAQAASG